MTRAELRTELLARGFDFLTPTRANQILEWARAELDSLYLWPYREESAVGTAPLAISDLGTVEAVINADTGCELLPAEYRDLIAAFGDLSTPGEPVYWYRAEPTAGQPEIATYPTSTANIGVQYWQITPAFDDDADEPLAPARYHDIVLELAVQRAYRDSDSHQFAEALQTHIDRRVARMVDDLFTQQVQGNRLIQMRGFSDDM